MVEIKVTQQDADSSDIAQLIKYEIVAGLEIELADYVDGAPVRVNLFQVGHAEFMLFAKDSYNRYNDERFYAEGYLTVDELEAVSGVQILRIPTIKEGK